MPVAETETADARTWGCLTPDQVIDRLERVFESAGARAYGGEAVTQAAHMLQSASLAEAEGACPSLVAAALLHDIGHVLGSEERPDAVAGADDRHSQTGADWLERWFGPDVTEPVRLHVAAKRYLCAIDSEYAGLLSAESARTLQLQGGPMSSAEVQSFAGHPFREDAVRLRRWDEAAKDAEAPVPDFAHFRALLTGLVRRCGSAGEVTGAQRALQLR